MTTDQKPEIDVEDVTKDERHVERKSEEEETKEEHLEVAQHVAVLVGAQRQQHGLSCLVN